MSSFKMKVKGLFFIDKKVIFAGDLEADSQQISNVNCKVLVNGIETEKFRIEGEVMGTGHRDLWTTSTVQIKKDIVTSQDVWLVSM